MVHSSPKVKSNAIVLEKKISKPPRKSIKREKSLTMERAERVQANLPSEFPCLVKLMLPSHVSSCFWLGLPKSFCDEHMPKQDETITLVDEYDQEFETRYLADKTGLSGGWRGFSIKHDLVEGDVVVFQLIRRWNFKVYIVRAKGLTEVDGAINLLTLDRKPLDAVREDSAESYVQPIAVKQEYHLEQEVKMESYVQPIAVKEEYHLEQEVKMEQSDEDSDGMGSEIVDGIELPESVAHEMPSYIQIKYYDLCHSQNTSLHRNLLASLNSSLVVGVISETVNIADAIKACRISNNSCRGSLSTWDKTLQAFEEFGMEVAFLRKRIRKLVELFTEEESEEMTRTRKEAEKEKAEEKMQNLENVIENLSLEIEDLKNDSSIRESFAEEANAPW